MLLLVHNVGRGLQVRLSVFGRLHRSTAHGTVEPSTPSICRFRSVIACDSSKMLADLELTYGRMQL